MLQVIATSRSPYHDAAAAMGVGYFTDPNDFCEEHPDVVILATSILSLEQVGAWVGGAVGGQSCCSSSAAACCYGGSAGWLAACCCGGGGCAEGGWRYNGG